MASIRRFLNANNTLRAELESDDAQRKVLPAAWVSMFLMVVVREEDCPKRIADYLVWNEYLRAHLEINPQRLPASWISLFLSICEKYKEGIPMPDLSRELDLARSNVITRRVVKLMSVNIDPSSKEDIGMGVLRVETDTEEGRPRKRIFLSHKGEEILNGLESVKPDKYPKGAPSMGDLARELGVARDMITRIVSALTDVGVVQVEKDDTVYREMTVKRVRLTEKGQALVKRIAG